MAKKALLMILDGWGIGKHDKGDVIYNSNPLSRLFDSSFSTLFSSDLW